MSHSRHVVHHSGPRTSNRAGQPVPPEVEDDSRWDSWSESTKDSDDEQYWSRWNEDTDLDGGRRFFDRGRRHGRHRSRRPRPQHKGWDAWEDDRPRERSPRRRRRAH